ncbi:hypothetical protein EJ07DRAFT_115300 [Lizonia empirigonia]|nr:hypothetical protein EJ07DRAFT_115300 [Lizonia empirigonia]
MFAPLAAAYKAKLAHFLNQAQGLTSITKRDFFWLFNAAWHSSFTEKLILKSFKATGISPCNPSVILERFKTTQTDNSRPNSSGSTSSPLQHENNNLRDALANEKKRRQRGKAVLLEPPAQYDGGAILWSPNKANKLREQQKLAKAQLLEERRLKRVAAKEERERLAAEKALQREEDKMAKQLHKQLQSDIKLSQKGKRQSLKPAKATEIVVVDEIAHVVNEAAPQLTRRGRPIRPPTKLLM